MRPPVSSIPIWDYPKVGLANSLRKVVGRMTGSLHSKAYEKFIEVLVAARHGTNLTQEMVAERLDKPQSYIAKIEGGERRVDVIDLIELAEAMHIDPTDLFADVVHALKPKK